MNSLAHNSGKKVIEAIDVPKNNIKCYYEGDIYDLSSIYTHPDTFRLTAAHETYNENEVNDLLNSAFLVDQFYEQKSEAADHTNTGSKADTSYSVCKSLYYQDINYEFNELDLYNSSILNKSCKPNASENDNTSPSGKQKLNARKPSSIPSFSFIGLPKNEPRNLKNPYNDTQETLPTTNTVADKVQVDVFDTVEFFDQKTRSNLLTLKPKDGINSEFPITLGDMANIRSAGNDHVLSSVILDYIENQAQRFNYTNKKAQSLNKANASIYPPLGNLYKENNWMDGEHTFVEHPAQHNISLEPFIRVNPYFLDRWLMDQNDKINTKIVDGAVFAYSSFNPKDTYDSRHAESNSSFFVPIQDQIQDFPSVIAHENYMGPHGTTYMQNPITLGTLNARQITDSNCKNIDFSSTSLTNSYTEGFWKDKHSPSPKQDLNINTPRTTNTKLTHDSFDMLARLNSGPGPNTISHHNQAYNINISARSATKTIFGEQVNALRRATHLMASKKYIPSKHKNKNRTLTFTPTTKAIENYNIASQPSSTEINAIREYGAIDNPSTTEYIVNTQPEKYLKEAPDQERKPKAHSQKRVKYSLGVKSVLSQWIHQNYQNPYPSRDTKKQLALTTGLSETQIKNWFGNAKRRMLSKKLGKNGQLIWSLNEEQKRDGKKN